MFRGVAGRRVVPGDRHPHGPRAPEQASASLARHGESSAIADRMMGFEEFGKLVGLDEKYELAERYRR